MVEPASTVLLGVDVGTTNVKTVAFSPAGKFLASHSQRLTVHHPRPGWSEYDPFELFDATAATIRAVTQQVNPAKIAGVAVCSMAETAVALDADGQPLRRAIAWHDERTGAQADWWREEVGDEAVYQICGLPILPIFGINKIMWIRDNEPDIYAKIRCWLNVADYITYRLSGIQATDFSLASRMMALNLKQRKWSDELCTIADIRQDLLAELISSGEAIGTVLPTAAEQTGIPAGVPVVAGGMDHPSGALALGIRQPGDVLDSMGTSESIFTVVNAPLLNQTMAQSGYQQGIHVNPNYSYCSGGLYTSGASVEWIREILANENTSYDELLKNAAQAPAGSDGLFFLPHLRLPSPPINASSARAVMLGLKASHNRGHVMRAVLEGLAYEARFSRDGLLRLLSLDSGNIRAAGGGTRNALLMDIKASVYGQTVYLSETDEASAQGAAMLAGIGAGVFTNFDEAIDAMQVPGQRVLPEAEWEQLYERGYKAIYLDLYQQVAPIHHKIDALLK